MKKLFISGLFALYGIGLFSQNFVYDWAKSIGGLNWDLAKSIQFDQNDNVYIAGGFEDVIYFDQDSLVSMGDRDVFIAKYKPNGVLIWVKQFGGKAYDNILDMQISDDNFIYLAGNFQDSCFIENEALATSSYMSDYVIQLSSNGHLKNLREIETFSGADKLFLNFDENENISVTGSFSDYIKIADDSIASLTKRDIFNAVFTHDLSFINLQTMQTEADLVLRDVFIENGYLYSACEFNGIFKTSDTEELNSMNSNDLLILKTDIALNLLNYKYFGGISNEKAVKIEYSQDSSLIFSGEFQDKLYYEGNELKASGNTDIFIIKLDSDLENILWANTIGGANNEFAQSIHTDDAGKIYLFGSFTNSLTVGNYVLNANNHKNDLFTAKYNPEGQLTSVNRIGGSDADICKLATDQSGYFYLLGNFSYSFALNTDSITSDTILSDNKDDVFLARFFDCVYADIPDIGVDTVFCEEGQLQVKNSNLFRNSSNGLMRRFEWNNGQTGQTVTVNTNGHYKVSTLDKHKCPVESDSIYVRIYEPLTSDSGGDKYAMPGDTLTLHDERFAHHLWSNRQRTNEQINLITSNPVLNINLKVECSGSGEQVSIIPAEGGNKIQNTENITVKSQTEMLSENELNVFPNPNSGNFTLSLQSTRTKISSIKVFTAEGRLVYENPEVSSPNVQMNISTKGWHRIQIQTADGQIIENTVVILR